MGAAAAATAAIWGVGNSASAETAAGNATPPRRGELVPPKYLGFDGNLFYYWVCQGVGEVICCNRCPHILHPACIPKGDPSKTSLENNDDPWYYHLCVKICRLEKSIVATKATPGGAKRRTCHSWEGGAEAAATTISAKTKKNDNGATTAGLTSSREFSPSYSAAAVSSKLPPAVPTDSRRSGGR